MRRAFVGAAVASLAVCGALAAVAVPGAGAERAPAAAATVSRQAPGGAAGAGPGAAAGTGGPGTDVASTPGSAFNPTDLAWLQLAAPMTEQAVRMAQLATVRAASPDLRELATAVAVADGAELARLQALLVGAGADRARPHEGHDMPGMTTAAEYAAAEQESGAAFDRLVGGYLREYLEQSVRLADSEGAAGREPATRELAADVRRNRAAELARLTP
ncbi:hypothetical protein GCM10010495_49660 [Kitasatospora herbaricolor]|uniref:DUF305 domain-containing protein n=1 Tax=Kitasatospora herbaricolor TaxID=68217 RepID=UPI001749DB34|nr:DUF305 domain-containing protein [Kitasatospora herbaricolor]MDQ0305670.1 uncharacterized protein (DUF305 family) [Kitasatospora herbaricolor]GGV27535.1 hypothetical protein GCM10010495_49660 [Kitasatospora herbaricolor]